MVISGIVIDILPKKLEHVKKELSGIRGLEIQGIIDDYKIIAVIVSEAVKDEIRISNEIAKIDGVVDINFIYHHLDEEECI
jgi:nitrate reductase NapAB chaperone NapD